MNRVIHFASDARAANPPRVVWDPAQDQALLNLGKEGPKTAKEFPKLLLFHFGLLGIAPCFLAARLIRSKPSRVLGPVLRPP